MKLRGHAVGAFHAYGQLPAQYGNAGMETPPSAPEEFALDTEKAKAIVEKVLARDGMMTEPEAKAVSGCYGIQLVEPTLPRSEKRRRYATEIGYPCGRQDSLRGYLHKSDVRRSVRSASKTEAGDCAGGRKYAGLIASDW